MYIFIRIKIRGANSHDSNELCLPSRLICQKIRQKTQRCRKNACDGLEMRITRKQKCHRHVCELWIAENTLFRLQS